MSSQIESSRRRILLHRGGGALVAALAIIDDGLNDTDENDGFNLSINGITYSVTTNSADPDPDGDGVVI